MLQTELQREYETLAFKAPAGQTYAVKKSLITDATTTQPRNIGSATVLDASPESYRDRYFRSALKVARLALRIETFEPLTLVSRRNARGESGGMGIKPAHKPNAEAGNNRGYNAATYEGTLVGVLGKPILDDELEIRVAGLHINGTNEGALRIVSEEHTELFASYAFNRD